MIYLCYLFSFKKKVYLCPTRVHIIWYRYTVTRRKSHMEQKLLTGSREFTVEF